MSSSGAGPEPLVLHVIPTALSRGAQREARDLVDSLDAPGQRRHRLLSLFAGPHDVPVDYALDLGRGPHPGEGFDWRAVPEIRRALRRLAPTVVVAHGGDPLKYLVAAGAGGRSALLYYAIGTFAHPGSRTRVALWRALVARATLVAAVGDEVHEECRTLLHVAPGRLVAVANLRDPAVFHPADVSARRDGHAVGRGDDEARRDVPVVAFVGALTPGKRPGRFVEVVNALRRDGVEFSALVCGDGPLAASLVGPAGRAGIELLGRRDDVAEVLRKVDLLVFPSLPTGEGMPGILVEAGLSGLPVVATAVPGVQAVVDDGRTGYVVGVDDTPAMVAAVGRLLRSPAERRAMGAAARRRCVERFSLDAVWDQWAPLLDPFLADPRRRRVG
jgi:glycosyltransferase involved in cell wall biosynthesis